MVAKKSSTLKGKPARQKKAVPPVKAKKASKKKPSIKAQVKEVTLSKTPPQAPGAKLQPYLAKAMEMNPRSGTRAAVYQLSQNEITPNKKPTKTSAIARYNSTSGRGGPAVDHFAPIVRKGPIAVTDMRQLATGNPYNIANEFGVVNDQFPLQEVAPTRGGQWSGRTGQIR